MKSATKDLTRGSPIRLIAGFAVPMLLGLLFQQLYNMADTIIVGKWLGVGSLAAVGSTGSISFMIIGFCTGVCSGFAIPVAQRFGSGEHGELRRFVANIIWVSAGLAALLTVLVCVYTRQILELMLTPADIIDEAYLYIFYIFLGIPVTFLYNLVSGIIRALGDSITPVYFLLLSAGLNVVLDILAVGVLHTGVEGPAIATVISQAVSGVLCLIYMCRKFTLLRMQRGEWRPSLHHIGVLLYMGLPMGMQYSVTAVGSVVLQSAVNRLGSSAVAAVTAGGKVSNFFCCPFDALGGTMATFAGQNVGAGKPDRIHAGLRGAMLMGAVYAAVAGAVLCLFGQDVALLFLDSDEVEILSHAQQFLTVNSLCYLLLLMVNVFRFCIQGMGYSLLAVLAGLFEMAARTAIAFGLVPLLGFGAVCYANPAAWLMADVFLIPAYFVCLRRVRRRFAGTAREPVSTQSNTNKGE